MHEFYNCNTWAETFAFGDFWNTFCGKNFHSDIT